MKKFILFILLVTVALSCKNEKSNRDKVAINYMENLAKETNIEANLPAQVDQFTIAEKVTFDSDKMILTYNYKLYTDKYGKSEWKNMLKEIENEQVQNAKKLYSQNEYYTALQVTIQSIYRDFDGNEIYSFQIKPEQYQ